MSTLWLAQASAPDMPPMQGGDIAWMLVATGLVVLMTPALGFFYGGMVRSKNSLNTMMMSFLSFGVVGVLWFLLGYSLAFSTGNSWLGSLEFSFLSHVGLEAKGAIPHLLFAAYQATFVIITAALISGAVVERMRFGPYLAFIGLWSLVVYGPLAHWVWGGGWLGTMGALDFAGGTVVHINAGVAAVVTALVLGPRKEYGRQALLPHNVPMVLLGAALLWFGWFGFNGGSALGANTQAALAFVNTILAPCTALLVWVMLDLFRTGRATAVGAATAIIVGLVGITPAAGFIGPGNALLLGVLVVLPSYYGILWRSRTKLDDSLDVFAGHGLGGITGALLTGILSEKAWGSAADGALYGNPQQLGIQLAAVVAAVLWSAVGTFVLLKVIGMVTPLRADHKMEGSGLDVTQHGEEAYSSGEGAILVLARTGGRP